MVSMTAFLLLFAGFVVDNDHGEACIFIDKKLSKVKSHDIFLCVLLAFKEFKCHEQFHAHSIMAFQ